MKKRLFLAGVAAAIMLAGCSNGETGETNTSAGAAEEATSTDVEVITVWSDNAHEQEIRERQIAEFNAGEGKELGIQIDYKVYGSNYSDTIKIAAKAGEAPDLYKPDSKWIRDFVDSDFLVPIEELPGSEALLERYKDLGANQSNIFYGKTYTLPYNLTTYGFVINKDLFKKAGLTEADYPTTWEEVRTVAKKITDACQGSAYGLGISSTLWTVSSFYTAPAAQNVGHGGYDWTAKQFNYSAFNPMIAVIDQMVDDGSVFPGFETLDGDGVRAQFAAGNIAMIGAASFDCAVYTNQFPATCDWEVIDAPKLYTDRKENKRFGSPINLLVVGAKAKEHPEKVLKVLEFFYDDKNASEMYENGLYIPARSEAIAMATKTPELKGWSSFASFDELFVMPPVPDTLINIEGAAYREAIVNIWSNPKLDDVQAVMADVDKRYNDALAKADQEQVAQYVLKDGITPETSK